MVGESVEQNLNDIKISTSPNGEEFILPGEADYRAENERLEVLVELGRGHMKRLKEEGLKNK